MDQNKDALLSHVEVMFDEAKRDINLYYSELILKIPKYLKTIKVSVLRNTGAIVDTSIHLPKKAGDHLRERAEVFHKVHEVHEESRKQITAYYQNNVQRKLPEDLLQKKMKELSEEEKAMLVFYINNRQNGYRH